MQLFPELNAKPFLKWAGGKTQLIPAIERSLSPNLRKMNFVYVEPFIGSGAILFWFLRTFPNIESAIINDVNSDLTNAYTTIKSKPQDLILKLNELQQEYRNLKSEESQKDFFLTQRSKFNHRKDNEDSVQKAALLIFLNRTCFNGLYRVNSKNEFNVPFGKYSNPKICDEETILSDSSALQKVIILNGDFEKTLEHVNSNAFFYFDPPYRPLNKTSSFNSYASEVFNDSEQQRLALFCKKIDLLGHEWLLSNSDPKNIDESDNFFDVLYSKYNIQRVDAKRMINSDSKKRGEIKELLISNYSCCSMPL